MTIESNVNDLISPIVRVYQDIPPDNPTFPYATYQQVGGEAVWNLEGGIPARNARIQVNVWANTRVQANTLALAIEDAISKSTMATRAYGAFTALYESSIKKYGTRQDFGIWER